VANRDDRFDLTIVDLPRWGIIELIQILHELDVPVLTLTNVQNLERCTRALQARANEVLSMASSEKNIVRMVNRLVSE
jgi:DNA-binding NarL/FixJ family response regulator